MLISQTALTVFVTTKALFKSQAFTPHALTPPPCTASVPNYTHFASLMVHPVTGKTISSYKWLMNNPATAKFWQVAFGKDFGRMAQGNEKTCQKGRKSMFVMNHAEIIKAYAEKQNFTYAKIVVGFWPQKEDPNQIRITDGGNLIQYKGNIST